MSLRTTTKQPHQPDDDVTTAELAWRNRHARSVTTNPPPGERTTEPVYRRRSSRPWFFIVAGMLTVLLLWIAFQQVVVPWWSGLHDQWRYGDSRVTVMDADVGHGGVSHFIAEYYHQSIVVVELPAAAFTKYQVYVMSGYLGASNPIVVLTIAPGQQSGKPNLIVSVEGTGYGRTLYNTGTGFSVNEVQP